MKGTSEIEVREELGVLGVGGSVRETLEPEEEGVGGKTTEFLPRCVGVNMEGLGELTEGVPWDLEGETDVALRGEVSKRDEDVAASFGRLASGISGIGDTSALS